MDVSKKIEGSTPELEAAATSGNGEELLEEVASLTGLPPDWVQTELTKIVTNSGHTPEDLTLDELRSSMLAYLEEMQKDLEAQEAADLLALDQMSALPGSDLSH